MRISTILDHIDNGSIALPEFQRGYVWNRDQVRGLITSLYQGYPIGSLLVWETNTRSANARGKQPLPKGTVKLLLDGQQRMTSLYGVIRGKPPKFFSGKKEIFTGIYFHLEDQIFEFYAPMKMKDNPMWINVTELMNEGAGKFIGKLYSHELLRNKMDDFITRLTAIDNIKNKDMHLEEVTGEDKTVDVVVDIFNKVNSGGTKLSKGDLALAKICAGWPEAREEMKTCLEKWSKSGYHFKLELFLRCINTITTGEALFSALRNVDTDDFQKGLKKAEKSVDHMLSQISSRLGLDHDRVFGSRYSLPLMVRYLDQKGGSFKDHKERDKLLYWYIHTFLWGRYAGSTESYLDKDLHAIEEQKNALDRLIDLLQQDRGDLTIRPDDFGGWSKGARFYPMIYMLTRINHSIDWDSGIELSSHILGKLSSLEVHHIFPRSLLYKHGYKKSDVNAIANFTFLTKDTNLKVSNRVPVEYLEEFCKKNPGAVESHWIPMDRELWKIDNYLEFLKARKELLAKSTNIFLESLLKGGIPDSAVTPIQENESLELPGGILDEEEEHHIRACRQWVIDLGLTEGEFMYELADIGSGDALATIDLAWPNGLQEGLSEPIALLIDEDEETHDIVNQAGFKYFTDIDQLKQYVKKEVLAIDVME